MPRPKRRAIERRSKWDCPRTRLRLLEGHDFEFLGGPELTREELAEAWEDLAEELLEQWTVSGIPDDVATWIAGEPARPGTRPWAWWAFDSPGPRRQVAPGPEPIGPVDWFGMPSLYRGVPPENMYEPEAIYLRRHGLLAAEERHLLAAQEHQREERKP
jgi:hypothetical protein